MLEKLFSLFNYLMQSDPSMQKTFFEILQCSLKIMNENDNLKSLDEIAKNEGQSKQFEKVFRNVCLNNLKIASQCKFFRWQQYLLYTTIIVFVGVSFLIVFLRGELNADLLVLYSAIMGGYANYLKSLWWSVKSRPCLALNSPKEYVLESCDQK